MKGDLIKMNMRVGGTGKDSDSESKISDHLRLRCLQDI